LPICAYTLGESIDDNYFSNNDEVRFLCGDFLWWWWLLAYNFEMMDCTCWVKHARWVMRWVLFSLIDVDKWRAYVDDLFRDWICMLCYGDNVIAWDASNGG
jgi:hypothetical protein